VQIFDISPGPFIWAAVTAFMIMAPAIVGGVLAAQRRRPWILGAAVGLLLNWVGVLLVALLCERSPEGMNTPTDQGAP
jgi:hypothetical protein